MCWKINKENSKFERKNLVFEIRTEYKKEDVG